MPLYCAEFGGRGKPTIVLLHGLGMAHRMWQPQFEALAQDFHVLAPDLPGFARSAGLGPFSLSGAAASVAELIRARGGAAATVCGLSLGGLVALQMALAEPQVVAGLILSAAQVRPPATLMGFQQLLFAVMPERVLLEGLASDLPTRDEAPLSAAREDARQTGKRGMLQAMRAAGRANFRPALSQIGKPTLVVCGSKDWANLPAARELARGIAGAELRVIEGAGHVWNLERPEEFTEIVSGFVRGASTRPSFR
jgi:3-oxoadipate enol-lactonase